MNFARLRARGRTLRKLRSVPRDGYFSFVAAVQTLIQRTRPEPTITQSSALFLAQRRRFAAATASQ